MAELELHESQDKSQNETLAFIPLEEDQTEQIKDATGLEVSYLLVERVARLSARQIDPGLVSITRLTWCW